MGSASAAGPKTALDVLETQLGNIMSELGSYNSIAGAQSTGYLALVKSLDKLHSELVRRSHEESDELIRRSKEERNAKP